MSGDVLLMCFLGTATIFLYVEKMKFSPPTGAMLWAWRLIYFGAALAFFAAGIFFYISGKFSEMPIVRSFMLMSLLIFGVTIIAGFALFLMASRRGK